MEGGWRREEWEFNIVNIFVEFLACVGVGSHIQHLLQPQQLPRPTRSHGTPPFLFSSLSFSF